MQTTESRKLDVSAPSRLGEGLRLLRLPMPECDLAAEVRRLLVAKGLTKAPVDLAELHRHVPAEMQVPDKDGLNAVTRSFYETDAGFRARYLAIVRHLAREALGFEFLFQDTPTMRFHFPVRFIEAYRDEHGTYLGHHNDGMLGHSFEEINCWLPLTDCAGSAALQIASLPDSIRLLDEFCRPFDHDPDTFHQGRLRFVERLLKDGPFRQATLAATRPYDMRYGEALLFESRCLHATAENAEGRTRISIDFRLIPLQAYERLERVYASGGRSKRKFVRGDVFSQVSSADLLKVA